MRADNSKRILLIALNGREYRFSSKYKALGLEGQNENTNEPVREKNNTLGFRPGPTQTGLYSHR